jgi:acetylornithine deacetylase/succinyl-diaminopimelate desuccinylase-like protein
MSRRNLSPRPARRDPGRSRGLRRIPSVSTDPAYAAASGPAPNGSRPRCGPPGSKEVAIRETGGHPCVTGHWLHAAGAPTILIYGHYDVQPPDPAEKWLTPAFEPTVRDGRLYARGVSDDKGPMLIPLWVAQAFLATEGACRSTSNS